MGFNAVGNKLFGFAFALFLLFWFFVFKLEISHYKECYF